MLSGQFHSGQPHSDQLQVVSEQRSIGHQSVLDISGFFVHCTLASFVALVCSAGSLVAGPQPTDQLCAGLFYAKRFISGQCHKAQFHRPTVASQVRDIFSFLSAV